VICGPRSKLTLIGVGRKGSHAIPWMAPNTVDGTYEFAKNVINQILYIKSEHEIGE
jgi:hypothetical protein